MSNCKIFKFTIEEKEKMSTVVCAWEMSDRWGAIVEIFYTQSSCPLGEMASSLLSTRLIIVQNTFQK